MTFTPNDGQAVALAALDDWWERESPRPFVLHGAAGAGKTTTVKAWCRERGIPFTPCAPTAKAARLWAGGRTVHKLLYSFPNDPLFGLVQQADRAQGEERKALLVRIRQMRSRYPLEFETEEGKDSGRGIIVLDECGMADQQVAEDLVALGRRIIALGDPFQLSPVSGVRAFMQADALLTEPMRFGPGSDVYALAEAVRLAELRTIGDLGRVLRPHFAVGVADAADIVLGSTRAGVAAYNDRRAEGRVVPRTGDLVMAKVNESEKAHRGRGEPTYNGQRFVVRDAQARDDQVWLDLEGWDHEGEWSGIAPLAPIANPDELEVSKGKGKAVFVWGWATTVHASQGSEWNHVHVLDDWPRWVGPSGLEEGRKLLYTAVSRAKRRVTTGPG